MSKIGKLPIVLPEGFTAEISARAVVIKNKTGELHIHIPKGSKASLEGNELKAEAIGTSKQARSSWGTLRALMQNAVEGLTKGFEKTLILEGVGYRITKEGEDLNLNLGFSHPVKYKKLDGISFDVEKNTILKIKGTDKALVGQVAAEIRALKKPEPYKGKGFHYSTEVVRRKAGKKAAATTK